MIRERIIKYLDYKGITKYKFYKDTGLSNGFLDKEGAIGSDKCEKISYQYSDLSLEWLITGTGEMIKNEKKMSSSEHTVSESGEYWKGRYDELVEVNKKLENELAALKGNDVTKSKDESGVA